MAAASGPSRAGWGAALLLCLVLLLLRVFYSLPLLLFPMAVLLIGLSRDSKWRVPGLVLLIWVALSLPADPLGALSRGWALLIGGAFLAATYLRPRWSVVHRALAAIGGAVVIAGLSLAAIDGWRPLDWMMSVHFHSTLALALGEIGGMLPESEWVAQMMEASHGVADAQTRVFPATLALQSLAALSLASWWLARMRGGRGTRLFSLRPLREFRFSDELVWLAIAGMLLLVLPFGALAARAGVNAVLFMGALYAVRGIGVFLYLAAGAPTVVTVIFGALAAIFLYPLVLTAALVVGLGDTWLDVRGRAAGTPRT